MQRFDCNTASLHQAMRSIVYVSLFVAGWFAAIGAFRSSLFRLLVSFDVESLFTNVPIEGAVKAALCKLENNPGLADHTNLTPTQIADLLNFVLRSTYFQYNGSIYERKDGAAMGSPVSAVIANLYMEEFEEWAIATATYKPKI